MTENICLASTRAIADFARMPEFSAVPAYNPIKEFQTGILCVNDISSRLKPKTEEKNPELLADIRAIMEPHSESESHLRTTLLYTNMTAKAVYDALVEKGWQPESLPTVRTISNILTRQNYRLRTVAKSKVQKKLRKPTPSSKTSGT